MKFQLKATVAVPADNGTHLSYSLQGIDRYDDLRSHTLGVPRFLVVLFLPPTDKDWLVHSVDSLILRRCAYWVSLRNAPATTNSTATTVYLPKAQIFGPSELLNLAAQLSNGAPIDYQVP